jgi:hypothetical protein
MTRPDLERGGARARPGGRLTTLPREAGTGTLTPAMAADPTTTAARALRALHVLASDLAAERRVTAKLRRENAQLREENDRLRAASGREPSLRRS